MGWTSYRASIYKNGKIDRKAEIEKEFLRTQTEGISYIERAGSMVGTTYYGAWSYSDQPDIVFGVVILTRVKDGDFAYKTIHEAEGPVYYDCPPKVLKLLTATEDENAKEWREKCRVNNERKRKVKSVNLNSLGVGSRLEAEHNGVILHIEKVELGGKEVWLCTETGTRFTSDFLKSLNPRIAKKVTNLKSIASNVPIGTVVELSNGEQFQRVSSRETKSKKYLWKQLNDLSNTETLATSDYIDRKNPVVIKQ